MSRRRKLTHPIAETPKIASRSFLQGWSLLRRLVPGIRFSKCQWFNWTIGAEYVSLIHMQGLQKCVPYLPNTTKSCYLQGRRNKQNLDKYKHTHKQTNSPKPSFFLRNCIVAGDYKTHQANTQLISASLSPRIYCSTSPLPFFKTSQRWRVQR